MSAKKVLDMIKKHGIKYVDLRFTNTRGKEQHVTEPASIIDAEYLKHGKWFDGSSIAGWKSIHESDMLLMVDTTTPVIDPFYADPTMLLRCDIIEPRTGKGYERDPRSIAKRAEAYLKKTKLADQCFFGPEPEFFVFDDVRWATGMGDAFFRVISEEAAWAAGEERQEGCPGHFPAIKGGYFPVPPVDSLQDIRAQICDVLEQIGIQVEVHHHEVGTAGQCEIGTRFNTLLKRADETQLFKYVVLNVAHQYGKTATFMPKPLGGENGNGMHVHQSLFKNGKNMFMGNEYAGLSKMALYYIGGIIKHARAINAFTNASTNSYKRLIPGYEAPTMLTYSASNRSAAIRIPLVNSPKARRIEIRFPDASGNPYLTFSAMLMAGLDGIRNKIDPGKPMDEDLYQLDKAKGKKVPQVCSTLKHALEALDKDRKFLTEGGVFTDDVIDAYIDLKDQEVALLMRSLNPVEFDMYYSC